MSLTPVWELPYPTDATTADVPADIQALADRIEDLLTAVDAITGDHETRLDALEVLTIKRGQVAYEVDPGELAAYTTQVNFGHTYASPPSVTATCQVSSAGQHVTASVYDVTTSGFKFTVKHWGGSSTQEGPLHWTAIGV